MPAGRPATTGESPIVRFRARDPKLAARLEARRTYPDLHNHTPYGGPRPKHGEAPSAGAAAARDLATYYALLDAALGQAAAELNRDQVLVILHAVQGLAIDTTWITNAPALLAGEIEDDHADDENGPGPEHPELAAAVRAWPPLQALAVLEACLAVRDNRADTTLEEKLAGAGLITRPKGDPA